SSSLACSWHASAEGVEPPLELSLRTKRGRHVVAAFPQRLRKIGLSGDDVTLEVVRVLVLLAVAQRLHEWRRGVAQMERDRIGTGVLEVLLDGPEAALERVRLRRKRPIHGRFGEREIALGKPDEMR